MWLGEMTVAVNWDIKRQTTQKLFLGHRIRISEILPWDIKSYLTHTILNRLSCEGYIHWLYWNSHHHVKLHLSVFRDC